MNPRRSPFSFLSSQQNAGAHLPCFSLLSLVRAISSHSGTGEEEQEASLSTGNLDVPSAFSLSHQISGTGPTVKERKQQHLQSCSAKLEKQN